MRKKISMMLVAILISMTVFVGCGKDLSGSPYVGKWTAVTAEYSGMSMGVDALFGEFTLDFQDNGKVVMVANGEETKGKWDESENGVIVSGGGDLEIADQDGKLVLEMDGVTVTFEKNE